MWKNFLLSMSLLAIALATALYSSSASGEGKEDAAAASAILSLALALWVGVRFVPRLARGVNWGWIPNLSRYTVTRDGWIYIITLAVVVFAAVNTSNNLLYMILSVLLAVPLLSLFLLELNFKFLDSEIILPVHVFASEIFPLTIRLHNSRRVFPMISVRIEPAADGPLIFEPVYFAAVDPLSDATLATEGVLSRRGRYHIRQIQGTSRFPFGLLLRSKHCSVDGDVTCYPAILSRERLNLSALDAQGTIQRHERGSGHDLHTIRDYQYSDGARHVHWKASAKTTTLKTREYAADESRRIILALDRFGTGGDSERFEELVSHAASLAFHCVQDGTEVVLVSDEWQSSPGAAKIVLDSILDYLAGVEMSENSPPPDVDPNRGSLLLSLRRRTG